MKKDNLYVRVGFFERKGEIKPRWNRLVMGLGYDCATHGINRSIYYTVDACVAVPLGNSACFPSHAGSERIRPEDLCHGAKAQHPTREPPQVRRLADDFIVAAVIA